MFIVCSSAEICSIVFGIKYCLIDTDPGLKYTEFSQIRSHINSLLAGPLHRNTSKELITSTRKKGLEKSCTVFVCTRNAIKRWVTKMQCN